MRLGTIALSIAALVAVAACGPEDESDKWEAEKKALEAKRKKVVEATKPDPNKKPPEERTTEELIEACETEAAACHGACAAKDAESCVRLGTHFEAGTGGVPENFDSARVFHRKGCDLGAGSGCYAMALFYKLGKSIPRSPKKALRYFTKGCELEFKPACVELEAMKKNEKAKQK
jgi:TPR repeat protein